MNKTKRKWQLCLRLLFLVFGLGALGGDVSEAQILTNPNQFSGSETVIDFESVAGETSVTTQLTSQGVTIILSDGLGAGTFLDSAPRQYSLLPGDTTVLTNFPPGVGSPLPDLTISFNQPVDRVAFEIRNNLDDDLNLSLKCLSSGQVVGTQFFVTDFNYQFVGLQGAVTFDQIIVDVTNNTNGAILLDNLRFEGPPTISIGDVTVTEGNSGGQNANFQVSLSAPSSQAVTVLYSTADGTATAAPPNNDFTPVSGSTVTIASGLTFATASVVVLGDNTIELDETFSVNLSSPQNATIADGQGQGTIVSS